MREIIGPAQRSIHSSFLLSLFSFCLFFASSAGPLSACLLILLTLSSSFLSLNAAWSTRPRSSGSRRTLLLVPNRNHGLEARGEPWAALDLDLDLDKD